MSEESTTLSQDAEKILELLGNLTVLDLSKLVKAMEEKFGVSAAMPVMAASMTAGAAPGGAQAAAEEGPSEVNVELTSSGAQKIAVIKAIRELTALGLKESKDIADGAPKILKEKVAKKEADQMKAKLEAAGATVTFK